MARLAASLYVSQMMRRVQAAGGFAAVIHKGADAAGAIHILVRGRLGITLYRPAPQAFYEEDDQNERLFEPVADILDDDGVDAHMQRERRFDPDVWLVELEPADTGAPLPFDVTKP